MKQEKPVVEAWVLDRVRASLRRRFPNHESRTLPFERALVKPVLQNDSLKISQGGDPASHSAAVTGLS
jgi:hypothetical protein